MRRTEQRLGNPASGWEVLRRAGVAFAVALPVYVAWAHGVLDFERNSALAASLLGAFVIYIFTRPRAVEWAPVLALGSACSALYFWRNDGFGGFFLAAPIVCGAMLGVASIMVLGIQAILCEPIKRAARLGAVIAAAFVPYLTIALAFAVKMTSRLHAPAYDLYLYAFDQSLRVPVGAAAARLLSLAPPLATAAALVYGMLPLAIGILIAVQRARPRWFSVDLIKLLLIAGIFGFLVYSAFPAAGPRYAFGQKFPGDLPGVEGLVIEPVPVTGVPRNAMPSLSLACVLLLWWNGRRLPAWGKVFMIPFAVLTILATLGLGEQYFIDLVVALPFTVAMQALALSDARMRSHLRWAPLAGGAVLTAGWLFALRLAGPLFQNDVWLSWGTVVGTLLLCALGRIMLDHAADGVIPQALNVTEFPVHTPRRAAFSKR